MTDAPEIAAPTKTCPRCAEEVKAAAQVCRYCGHEFGAAVPPPPPPGMPVPAGPPASFAGAPVPDRPRRRVRWRTAVTLVVLAITGVALVSMLTRGTAADPGDLAARFPEAGITCRDLDVIFDERASKALGCAGTDGLIITITTYGSRPAPASWVRDRCAAATAAGDGAYLAGDGFIIDIRQGPYPADLLGEPATPIDAANRLATVLGGAASTYACP